MSRHNLETATEKSQVYRGPGTVQHSAELAVRRQMTAELKRQYQCQPLPPEDRIMEIDVEIAEIQGERSAVLERLASERGRLEALKASNAKNLLSASDEELCAEDARINLFGKRIAVLEGQARTRDIEIQRLEAEKREHAATRRLIETDNAVVRLINRELSTAQQILDSVISGLAQLRLSYHTLAGVRPGLTQTNLHSLDVAAVAIKYFFEVDVLDPLLRDRNNFLLKALDEVDRAVLLRRYADDGLK